MKLFNVNVIKRNTFFLNLQISQNGITWIN